MKCLLSIAVLLISTAAAADCTNAQWTSGKAQVTVSKLDDGTCNVDVTATWEPGLLYRDYSWDSTGELMVFDSYGDGAESTHTGAQDYIFFPRVSEVSASTAANGDVIVHAANGQTFTVSAVTAQISAVSGGTVTVASSISTASKSGVSFPTYNGLMLDGGFALGHDPLTDMSNKISLRDGAGVICQVATSEVYKLTTGGDPVFIQSTDESFKAWLKNRCPKLNPGF